MPCKKKTEPKPRCTVSSRRLLETVAIQDLRQAAVVCISSSKQVNELSPSECSSCHCTSQILRVGAPSTCCTLDIECVESDTSLLEQELKTPSCAPNCMVTELETMIDEIRNCREIIQTLTLEAMNILHPEYSEEYKQNIQTRQSPIANGNVSSCEHDDDSEANSIEPASQTKPIDLRQKTDCSKKRCETSEPRKYLRSEGQSMTELLAIPPTLLKSPVRSIKSSGPIAQTTWQLKDNRLCQKIVGKKPSNCSCDKTINKTKIGLKPIECSCDGEKNKKPDCSCDEKPKIKTDCKTFILKTIGKTSSECSCDGEKNKKADCSCDEKPEIKTDCKTFILKTIGKKPSECSCDGEKKKKEDCSCDETMKKQEKENEKRENKIDSKTCLQKKIEWISGYTSANFKDACVRDDEAIEKQNKVSSLQEKRKAASVAVACSMPKCAANTCTCHFPPAYSQYFNCTGHVSGNCHCDKNA